MIDFKKADWRLIAKENKKQGYSVWEHLPTGDYSIRDMSGSYPHLTEDGVLWIKGIKGFDGKIVQLSVISERDGNEYSVFVEAEFASELVKVIPLKCTPEALHKILKNAERELHFATQLLSLSLGLKVT